MSEIPVKQSNFISSNLPEVNTEGANQDPQQHMIMVDRDLSHMFQYTNDLTTMVSGLSTYVNGITPSTTRIYNNLFSHDIAVAGTQNITGVGFTPSLVYFFGGITNTPTAFWGLDGGGVREFVSAGVSTGGYVVDSGVGFRVYKDSTNYAYAYISSLDADGFTMTWAKVNSPTGTAAVNYLAIRQ